MIILDTNVLSELTRPRPESTVVAWLDAVPASELATTAITVSELRYGVTRLSDGRRKLALVDSVDALIAEFAGRIEPFDAYAAEAYPLVVTRRERLGRPISTLDAQIAAICRARQVPLATRNTKDFLDTGIELVDPWQGAGR